MFELAKPGRDGEAAVSVPPKRESTSWGSLAGQFLAAPASTDEVASWLCRQMPWIEDAKGPLKNKQSRQITVSEHNNDFN
jgi:hypothetical protein